MKIVIIEDETAATINLLSIIGGVSPGAEIVATIESITEAVEWFDNNNAPDLIFMDIHLADGNAFRIFEKTAVPAPVIFTTAYDEYAIEAFHLNSIDYLLKPIKSDDLKRALEKFERFSVSNNESYNRRIQELAVSHIPATAFLVHVKDKLIPVNTEDIAFLYTSNEQVTLYTINGDSFPYHKSLDTIISDLPSRDFFRANRQFIISRRSVSDIAVWFGSRLCVNLEIESPERIIVSKARVPVFKRWLTGEDVT